MMTAKEEAMARLEDVCRENGIKVFALSDAGDLKICYIKQKRMLFCAPCITDSEVYDFVNCEFPRCKIA